jgi:ABC-type phosphate transport system permease subunit
MRNTPRAMKEASLALEHRIGKRFIKCSNSIFCIWDNSRCYFLGIGRAIGEPYGVLMVTGMLR